MSTWGLVLFMFIFLVVGAVVSIAMWIDFSDEEEDE